MKFDRLHARLWIGIVVVCGCFFGEPPVFDDPSARIVERVEADREWRDAWKAAGGTPYAFRFENPPAGSAIRLGFLAPSETAQPIGLTVRYENDALERTTFGNIGQWQDVRIPLDRFEKPPGSWMVELHSPAPFWISDGELIPPEHNQPNVLVFLVDTLRRDRLGVYGYPRDTSPNIDAFAEDAVRYTGLIAPSSWTRPSVATLLTSTQPHTHGGESRVSVVRDGLPWLPEFFNAAGYETQAFFSNPNVLPVWGFGDEFRRVRNFVRESRVLVVERDEEDVVEESQAIEPDNVIVDSVVASLETMHDRPWFFYVHTMAPHHPYEPPPEWRAKFETPGPKGRLSGFRDLFDRYDGEIGFVDHQFGRLVSKLKQLGVYDNTLIVVVSDHGESLGEQKRWVHGNSLYNEQLFVPLLVKLPGQRLGGTVANELVKMADIAPTILDALGMEIDPRFEGKSLFAPARESSLVENAVYSTLRLDEYRIHSLQTAAEKYMQDLVTDTEYYFDLEADPKERSPLSEPGDTALALAQRAAQYTLKGKQGLHILIASPPDETHSITGTAKAPGANRLTLRYRPDLAQAQLDGDTISFEVQMQDAADADGGAWTWMKTKTGAERNYAHLFVECGELHDTAIEMTVDGEPIDRERVFIGAERIQTALDGSPLQVAQLLANPIDFEPAKLPLDFAVYVYQVVDPEKIGDSELDPGVVEALETLGYVD